MISANVRQSGTREEIAANGIYSATVSSLLRKIQATASTILFHV